MAVFDDPAKRLKDIQEELLLEELMEEYTSYEPPEFDRALYSQESEAEEAARYGNREQVKKEKKQRKKKKKGIGGLLVLAALELGAILLIVRWWLQWL